MARAPQVEFPGKKRQRVRMRGTKHANEDTAKRLRRNLDRLLEHPERALPELAGSVRRGWRRDPIDPRADWRSERSRTSARRKAQIVRVIRSAHEP